jgi:hypothetical protein
VLAFESDSVLRVGGKWLFHETRGAAAQRALTEGPLGPAWTRGFLDPSCLLMMECLRAARARADRDSACGFFCRIRLAA